MPLPSKPKRDALILQLWLKGWTYKEIEAHPKVDVGTDRINQIIAEQRKLARKMRRAA